MKDTLWYESCRQIESKLRGQFLADKTLPPDYRGNRRGPSSPRSSLAKLIGWPQHSGPSFRRSDFHDGSLHSFHFPYVYIETALPFDP